MSVLRFILFAFLVSYFFKSVARGLITFTDKVWLKRMGLQGLTADEVLQRMPRQALAWNYFQAISIGVVYALVIVGLRDALAGLDGGGSWLFTPLALLWAVTAGMGFKTNPGSVFFSCFFALLLNLLIGPWGSLIAWLVFMMVIFALLRNTSRVPQKHQNNESVIIDVEPDS